MKAIITKRLPETATKPTRYSATIESSRPNKPHRIVHSFEALDYLEPAKYPGESAHVRIARHLACKLDLTPGHTLVSGELPSGDECHVLAPPSDEVAELRIALEETHASHESAQRQWRRETDENERLREVLRGLTQSIVDGRQWREPAACVLPWLDAAHAALAPRKAIEGSCKQATCTCHDNAPLRAGWTCQHCGCTYV